MEVSIYKLTVSKDYFINKLVEQGMNQYGKEIKIKVIKEIGEDKFENEISASFYFKKEWKESDITWYEYWADLFSSDNNVTRNIESAYGVIIINIDNKLYGISQGIGYHYTNQNSYADFGFEIAERIINREAITLKSVKFYKQTKSRSLTQYHSTFAVSEVGESNELVIGKLNIAEKLKNFVLKKYTDDAVFGTAVKINVKDYNPKEILELVFELHLILNEMESVTSFPRLKLLPNNENYSLLISDLNKKLLDDFLNKDKKNISLSYFTERDGNVVVYSLHSNIEISYSYKYENTIFNIESIRNVLRKLECEDIDKVRIKTSNTGDKSRPIKQFLDYSTEYKGDYYCLHKGRWAKFNESYFDFVNREIISVNQITQYIEDFNLTEDLLNLSKLLKSKHPGKYHNVKYTEYNYNIAIANNFKYKLYDRHNVHDIFKGVEFADLYNEKEKEIIHVKIGEVVDWRYCISQSLQVAPLLNLHRTRLLKDGVPEVSKMTLLFIVSVKNIFEGESINFAKNNSLYFKTEIIEWLNVIRQYGFEPRIIIAKNKLD